MAISFCKQFAAIFRKRILLVGRKPSPRGGKVSPQGTNEGQIAIAEADPLPYRPHAMNVIEGRHEEHSDEVPLPLTQGEGKS